MKLAMVFPGQGSQSVGMLKEYAGLPEVDAVRSEAEEALGRDLIRLLDEGDTESATGRLWSMARASSAAQSDHPGDAD